MSEELTRLEKAIETGFSAVNTRCAELSGEIRGVSDKVIALGTRWEDHMHTHEGVDKRLEGLEDREREVTKTGIKLEKPSVPPRRNGNGRWTPERIKSYLMIGFFVMVGAMVAWNTVSSASKEDVEAVQERADSVAGAVEDKLRETRDVDEKVKKSYEELRKISQILGDVLGPETVVKEAP